jgi:hypothetical protein
MSLDVEQDLLDRAEQGEIDERDFVACVRTSLPYAWDTIAALTEELAADRDLEFADNQVPPPDEQARGQLLRALASNAIRQSLERHFGVTLAFQNCHRVAVFPADAAGTSIYQQFSSPRAQLLNQSPLLRDC